MQAPPGAPSRSQLPPSQSPKGATQKLPAQPTAVAASSWPLSEAYCSMLRRYRAAACSCASVCMGGQEEGSASARQKTAVHQRGMLLHGEAAHGSRLLDLLDLTGTAGSMPCDKPSQTHNGLPL